MNTVSESSRTAERGFTLIELSIVLVIIGLIVGGILVGQDLIKGAEIRATIAQIEKYNSAVNTFRNKYNGIPGDLAVTTASSFGLFSSMSGNQYYGDGNGLIEGGATTSTSAGDVGTSEPLVFWRHMSDAGFVDGSFGSGTTLAANGTVAASCTSAGACNNFIPAAKLGRGNSVIVAASNGVNYFAIEGVTGITTATGAYAGTNSMTPQEAYNIDKKVDDGLPVTGSVVAVDSTTANLSSTLNSGTTSVAGCVTSSAYNLGGTFGTTQYCALRMRFN